ncbi:MAG: chemotaxis protein CheW [Pseudomonadales bacterium]|jgi:two-component system, chemotaxis family, chemotaxis protein CheV|nr:chemotaxis protein CheW [Pseudomonadales bacterium]MCK5791446.1 chemotaxis protein CheV [Ketobacter sp.]MEC8810537.1 chemotaxis protein [Pseudomonadota bacterium]TNC89726.1 MAG: chemotaxis protein CheW [Alcanivorax sp.]HAG93145.1 chemotaxis protein CheW [Gammaproteobacteria bacterium]|tara:strand:+ start:48028 stop:48975 length:948 start_codon:yes stop_codon:yes gene_type:complete
MAGVLDTVDQRTQLVGQNRLELLLFRLSDDQIYGINVFKVREVLQCPKLTQIPQRNPVVRGIAHIRGGTISVMDMNLAMGNAPLDDIQNCFVIISEYNMAIQGFLVKSVERIVNLNWESIHPPPKGAGRGNYLTAVTELDNRIVEIIDVEKILSEVSPMHEEISAEVIRPETISQASTSELAVLIADDSSVARKQIKRCVEKVGVKTHVVADGRQALDHIREIIDAGESITDRYIMLISDIEMPEMDGYTLTASIKEDPRTQNLHVLLHTSLSGIFNEAMVKRVGADNFLAKFKPDNLADLVQERVSKALEQRSE